MNLTAVLLALLTATATCAGEGATCVVEGLKIAPAGGLRVSVTAGECLIAGRTVRVASPVTLELEPLEVHQIRNERPRLAAGEPKGFAKGTRLRRCISRRTTLPGCLRPGSVAVKDAPDGRPYELGKDYLIDEKWAMLGRVEGGRIGADTEVCIDYAFTLSRIDTVQIAPGGKVTVRRGAENLRCPRPAGAEEGCLAVANVFLDYNTAGLTARDIYPIGPPLAPPSAEELRCKAARVAKARRKLENGGRLRIGFWGDSVTVGYTASRPEKSFVRAFVAELRRKYPGARIEFFNAGVSGSNTTGRLPNFQREVIDKKPDLVIVEFVNDMRASPERIRENYTEAIGRVRAIGTEVILVTPHFTMPEWMGMEDLWGKDRRPACLALRQLAEEKQVGLADASRVWEHLCREGIPYTSLLYNRINHPDDRGHRIFVDELMKFF